MVDRSLILPNEKGVMLAVSHCRGKNDSHIDDSWESNGCEAN